MNFSKKNIKTIILIIAFAIGLYFVLDNPEKFTELIRGFIGIIWPLLLGGIIAFILNIPVAALERGVLSKIKKTWFRVIKRPVSIIMSIIIILGIIAVVIGLVVPNLAEGFSVIAAAVPVYTQRVQSFLLEHTDKLPMVADAVKNINLNWGEIGTKLFDFAGAGAEGLLGGAFGFVSSFLGGTVNSIVALIFAIYILAGKEKLARQFMTLLNVWIKPEKVERIIHVLNIIKKSFSSFISGQCIEATILGILCSIGMLILRLPYASMIGALVCVTALIPVAGAFIGFFVGAFMILMVNPIKALVFAVFFLVLQQIEGNLIYPRVVGKSIGLPAIWTLAGITLGAGVGGVIGMLLGVPTISVLYILIKEKTIERQTAAVNVNNNEEE